MYPVDHQLTSCEPHQWLLLWPGFNMGIHNTPMLISRSICPLSPPLISCKLRQPKVLWPGVNPGIHDAVMLKFTPDLPSQPAGCYVSGVPGSQPSWYQHPISATYYRF